MTSETRTLIELKDITGIEFKCKHCCATLLYPIGDQLDPKRVVSACPNCKEEWFVFNGERIGALDLVREFLTRLKALTTREEIKAQISWQVNCPKPSAFPSSEREL